MAMNGYDAIDVQLQEYPQPRQNRNITGIIVGMVLGAAFFFVYLYPSDAQSVNFLATVPTARVQVGHASLSRPVPPTRLRSSNRRSVVVAAKGDDDADPMEEAKKVIDDLESKIAKAMESAAERFDTIRAGRANPNMLNRVVVDAYGQPGPISNVASVSIPSSDTLCIKPFDKTLIQAIEKGIVLADLGFNPSNDGNNIYVKIPTLTEERRKDLTKQMKAMGEDAKKSVRNVRQAAIKSIDKLDSLPKDSALDKKDEIQAVIDKNVKAIEDMMAKKEKDLMTL